MDDVEGLVAGILARLVEDPTRSIWVGKDYCVADLRGDLVNIILRLRRVG